MTGQDSTRLPPLCYIRHVTTSETVAGAQAGSRENRSDARRDHGEWHRTQRQALTRPHFTFRPPIAVPVPGATMHAPIEARIAGAAEELRSLHESGEIAWTDLRHSPPATWRSATTTRATERVPRHRAFELK